MEQGRGTGAGLRLWRISWLAFLIGLGLLASAWWWLAPGGFGPGHPRFWLNRVAAPTIAIAAVATLGVLHRQHWDSLRWLLAAWPAGLSGIAVALRFAFPVTMGRLWLAPLGIGSAMGLAAIRPWRMGSFERRRPGRVALVIGGSALVGAMIAAALRPSSAGTHPLDPAIEDAPLSGSSGSSIRPGSVRLGPGVMIQTSDGSLMARVEPLTILVQPMLRFLSQSPDGAPVALVPASDRAGPEPRFRAGSHLDERSCRLAYRFPGQGPATLAALFDPDRGATQLEAVTRLDRPVFSHLNGFCDVEVRGHRRLALEFSPCPGVLVDVRHFGYPAGRPARFAYVEADRTFRVVEASSGEKGPFRTLARGRLERDEALAITLHDDRPIARLTLDDFAPQADTTPSPTAGWGVPVNAIEFSLSDDRPAAPASIFVTIAGGAIAPMPRVSAVFPGFPALTRLESATSRGGPLECRGAFPVK